MDINKIIGIVHTLKEEGMGVSAIANVTNPQNGPINIAGLPPDPPPVFNKGRHYAKGGRNSRRWWLQFLKGKENV